MAIRKLTVAISEERTFHYDVEVDDDGKELGDVIAEAKSLATTEFEMEDPGEGEFFDWKIYLIEEGDEEVWGND